MAIISNATTMLDAGAFSASLGSMVHIKTLTASSSGTLSFVNGASSVVLDDTYPIYKFLLFNIHPGSSSELTFNASDDTSSHAYNISKTTTHHYTVHGESGGSGNQYYVQAEDLANSTAFQHLMGGTQIGRANGDSHSGELTIFNPSSTTFMKHFTSRTQYISDASQKGQYDAYQAGYFNITAALTAFQFKMNSGNIDTGKIKLYGIKDS